MASYSILAKVVHFHTNPKSFKIAYVLEMNWVKNMQVPAFTPTTQCYDKTIWEHSWRGPVIFSQFIHLTREKPLKKKKKNSVAHFNYPEAVKS